MKSWARHLVFGLLLATAMPSALAHAQSAEQILIDKANYWRLKDRPDLATEAMRFATVMAFVDGTLDNAKLNAVLRLAAALKVETDFVHDIAEVAQGRLRDATAQWQWSGHLLDRRPLRGRSHDHCVLQR